MAETTVTLTLDRDAMNELILELQYHPGGAQLLIDEDGLKIRATAAGSWSPALDGVTVLRRVTW